MQPNITYQQISDKYFTVTWYVAIEIGVIWRPSKGYNAGMQLPALFGLHATAFLMVEAPVRKVDNV